MRIVEADLASVTRAQAYQIGDVLLLMLAGEKPTACHVVTIERSMLDVEPPAFIARLSTDPHVKCTDAVAPYEVHAAYRIGSARDEIVVHHADGEMNVVVEHTEPQGVISPILDRELVTVTGYSREYDLGAAIQDALAKIPPLNPGIPDWLSTYTVDSMRIEKGGIGGFDHLAVEITG